MSALHSLKSAASFNDFASLLGYKPKGLAYILYTIPVEHRYSTFKINKKSGGEREIKAPIPHLKEVQQRLSALLYECRKEIEADRGGAISHGFRRGYSIVTNARPHKCRRYVLNLDLENFFPTFTFQRVRGYFIKDKAFALNPKVATVIAQIACDGIALPQGSPCSPIISDLIGQILDLRLVRFAKEHRVTYSRYADDLTFSTNQKNFPPALAVQNPQEPSEWLLGKELIEKIEGTDFKINAAKTRMHCRGSRQLVTGLVVNAKVNIRSEYYRKARSMCQALLQDGQYHLRVLPPDEGVEGAEPKPDLTSNIAPLEGVLSHIYYVKDQTDRRPDKEKRDEPSATAKLYRRFLFYKYFVRPEQPLIIGEGKTDGMYLREAIKHLPQFQPSLGAFDGKVFKLALKIFRYSRLAHDIMELGGGSGDLRGPVLDYLRLLKKINHRPMAHPVILVLDNDNGLEPVAGVIRKNFKVDITLTTTAPFYHVTHNLYVVKTPEKPPQQSCIEDLFTPALLQIQLDGKPFNPKKAHGAEGEYGKAEFADKVVRANAHTIDFSGFVPLLARIEAAIAHHHAKTP